MLDNAAARHARKMRILTVREVTHLSLDAFQGIHYLMSSFLGYGLAGELRTVVVIALSLRKTNAQMKNRC